MHRVALLGDFVSPFLEQEDLFFLRNAFPEHSLENSSWSCPKILMIGPDKDHEPILHYLPVVYNLAGDIGRNLLIPLLRVCSNELQSCKLRVRGDLTSFTWGHHMQTLHSKLIEVPAAQLPLQQLKRLNLSVTDVSPGFRVMGYPRNSIEALILLQQFLRRSTASSLAELLPELQQLSLSDTSTPLPYAPANFAVVAALISEAPKLSYLFLNFEGDSNAEEGVTPGECLLGLVKNSRVKKLRLGQNTSLIAFRYIRDGFPSLRCLDLEFCQISVLFERIDLLTSKNNIAAEGAVENAVPSSCCSSCELSATDSVELLSPCLTVIVRVLHIRIPTDLEKARKSCVEFADHLRIGPELWIDFEGEDQMDNLNYSVYSWKLTLHRITRIVIRGAAPRRFPLHEKLFSMLRFPSISQGFCTPDLGYTTPDITTAGAWTSPRENKLHRPLSQLPCVVLGSVGKMEVASVAKMFGNHPDFSTRRFAVESNDSLGHPFTSGPEVLRDAFERFCPCGVLMF